MPDAAAFDAVLVAGGAARRLGGADKPALHVAGRSLLQHAVDAVAGAGRTVVVGPRRPLDGQVVWRLEAPPGAGPVAAIAAGLAATSASVVLVLAADLPWIAPAVPALRQALAPDADVAVLVDGEGRRNTLAAAWRRASLAAALAAIGDPSGVPVRALYRRAHIMEVTDTDGWGRDCDTWPEIAAARSAAEGRPPMTNPLDAWVDELAAALGVDAGAVDRTLLLDVARDAAHGVSRPAAPLTTFLVGLAAGRDRADAAAVRAAAETAQRLLATHASNAQDESGTSR